MLLSKRFFLWHVQDTSFTFTSIGARTVSVVAYLCDGGCTSARMAMECATLSLMGSNTALQITISRMRRDAQNG